MRVDNLQDFLWDKRKSLKQNLKPKLRPKQKLRLHNQVIFRQMLTIRLRRAIKQEKEKKQKKVPMRHLLLK